MPPTTAVELSCCRCQPARPSDVTVPFGCLCFLGATGDLAYKKIFPALQAMIRHGELDMPIIGIARAGWTLETARARARIAAENGGVDERAFARLARNCASSTAITTTRLPTSA